MREIFIGTHIHMSGDRCIERPKDASSIASRLDVMGLCELPQLPHMLPQVATRVYYELFGLFCDDPVCPDPRLEAVGLSYYILYYSIMYYIITRYDMLYCNML